jgi:hypothetical protein
VRQLHLYNFHKRKAGKGCLVFHNPCFQRDRRYPLADAGSSRCRSSASARPRPRSRWSC